jgi:hypothetical protein
MQRFHSPLRLSAALVAAALFATAFDAAALDGYRDRRGIFTGIGIGGAAAIQDKQFGGEAGLELQLGGGAAKWLAVSLDVDGLMQRVDGKTNWILAPGPQIDIFILNALFVSAGVGLGFVFPDDDFLPNGESFTLALKASGALGYEFFVGADVAIDLAFEGDYFAIGDGGKDAACFGFWLSFRYY